MLAKPLCGILLLLISLPVASAEDSAVPRPIDRFQDVVFTWPTIEATVWKGPIDSREPWQRENLWTLEFPDEESIAYHVNPSTILLSEGNATAKQLRLNGRYGSLPVMEQTGGTLSLSERLSIHSGEYQMVGGSLTVGSLDVRPVAFDVLELITVDIENVPFPEGTCIQDFRTDVYCPPVPQAESRFNLLGGSVDVAGDVRVGEGNLDILGGQLHAKGLLLNDSGTSALGSTADEPRVAQRGGRVEIEELVRVQDGIFALSGGILKSTALAMGDPAFGSPSPILFPTQLRPVFLQTGGELRLEENLEMCIPGFQIPIGPRFTNVTYRLEAGSVDVGGDTVVGSLGVAPALFLQSAGSHSVAGSLRIEGVESRYEIIAGELQVGQLEVGTEVFNEGGLFSISAAARVSAEDRITLGTQAEVQATHGSKIQLTGGDVEILGRDAALLTGLENLALEITGGNEVSSLEVASQDSGNSNEGFSKNFAWRELIVGTSSESGWLKLVDTWDNQFTDQPEALYVDRLVVAAGSTLNLGGLNLYYRESRIEGEVVLSGGAMIAMVPEPATLLLVSMAFCVLDLRLRSENRIGRINNDEILMC